MNTEIIDLLKSEINSKDVIHIFESEINRLLIEYSKLKAERDKTFRDSCNTRYYLDYVIEKKLIQIDYFKGRIKDLKNIHVK